MSIKGIRAFSPDNDEKITFYKPLTLIVGHNGAGKTVGLCALFPLEGVCLTGVFFSLQTIIECLKMACTGDLPPNVKSGQNFIHDPKVAGEVEVKAQIKLCFNGPRRGSFMAIRNFSLSQKQKTLKFKAVDNALTIWDPEIQDYCALPQRCSNINQEVPYSMGVTKAILENVIFVHQEESNWPLSDASTVKKRFDDIFAATKYTKALDELKKLRNKEQTEAREKRLQLETLRSYRNEAQRLRVTISDGEHSIEAHNNTISSLRSEIAQIDLDLEVLQAEMKDISNKKGQVSSIKARYDILQAELHQLVADLREKYKPEDFDVSIQEVEGFQAEFGPRLVELEESMQQVRGYIADAEENIRDVLRRKDILMKSYGQAIGKAEAFRSAKGSLVTLLGKIRLEIDLPFHGNSNVGRQEALVTLDTLYAKENEMKSQIEQIKSKQRSDQNSLQSTIDSLNDRISAAKEKSRLKKEAVESNGARITEIQQKLSDLQSSIAVDVESRHSFLVEQLRAAERELKQMEEEFEQSNHGKRIQDLDAAIQQSNGDIQKLRQERSKVASAGESSLRMKIRSQELQKLKQKEQSFRAINASRLAIDMGIAPASIPHDGSSLKSNVKEFLHNKEKADAKVKEVFNAAKARHAEAKFLLDSKQKALSQAEEELNALQNSIHSKFDGNVDNLSEEIASLQGQKEENVKKVNYCDAYVEIWTKQKEHASCTSTCWTCSREFANDSEKSDFITKTEKMILESPAQVSKAQGEIEILESKLRALQIIEPDAQRYKRLKNSVIPRLVQEVQDASDEFTKVTLEVQAAEKEMETSRSSLAASSELFQSIVLPWCQMMAQIEEDEAACKHHMDLLGGSGGSRTIEDIDNELTMVESSRASKQEERDKLSFHVSELEKNVSKSRNQVHKLQEEIRTMNEGYESKISFERELNSLIEENEIFATEVAELSIELKSMEEKKVSLVTNKENSSIAFEETLGKLQTSLQLFQTFSTQIKSIEPQFGEGDPDQAARDMERSLKQMEDEKTALDDSLRGLQAEMAGKSEEFADAQEFTQQLSDILHYKRKESELQKVRTEMEQMGVDDSVFEREAIIAEKAQNLQQIRSAKQSEADMAAGSYAAITENIKNAKDRLHSAEFSDIDSRYFSQLTEAESIEMATADLEKYYKALERALLAFHASKMSEINKTIKELWQKTYRGVDIDYIQIKADTETTSQRAAYNYRVVMYVGGAELDMRGRCSAGQKVLACLIIRLALAENFCLNCGVLALDEPTTNLDAENSASLAEALKSLMIARKDFDSFQLIVITHDEEFARRLGSREYIEYLWRVTKDENQHSRIHREPID